MTPELCALIRDQFHSTIASGTYPCLGARSAAHRNSYDIGIYEELTNTWVTGALADELMDFSAKPVDLHNLSSYVAVFAKPTVTTPDDFARLLWKQLDMLAFLDERPWAEGYSSDRTNNHYAFSFWGRAYFVVGLHTGSERYARRFSWPTLIFNPHDQFVAMRKKGTFCKMRNAIRANDAALQGCPNPLVADPGEASEAIQYASIRPPD